MSAEIEIGDLVVDDEQRCFFVVKRYVTQSGFEACDVVPAEDPTPDDVWLQPLFFYAEHLAKVLSWKGL